MKIGNIKFKAKRLDNGEWVKGDLAHSLDGGLNIFGFTRENGVDCYSGVHLIDPATVCQFTGFTDCEGKEIWEGDLLQIHIKAAIYEVVWHEKIGGFVIKVYTTDKSSPDLLGYELQTYKYKIVGNKFDKEKYVNQHINHADTSVLCKELNRRKEIGDDFLVISTEGKIG